MKVEILALDYNTCGRCNGTLSNLRQVLDGWKSPWDLEVHHIATREQAIAHRLVSSPTLRVNGNDLPLPLSQSSCGDCSPGDAIVVCRSWIWEGQEYSEPPLAMLRALLQQAAELPIAGEPQVHFELPSNLEVFFSGQGQGCCGPTPCGCQA